MSQLSLAELRDFTVPSNSLTVWWLGQSSYFLKTPGGVLITIDPYLSNVCKKDGDLYGLDANRRIPAPMTPEELVGVDLYVLTHSHLDHMDPGTIPGYRKAGGKGRLQGDGCGPSREPFASKQDRVPSARDR